MIESRHTVRPYLPWTVAVGQMDLWRWVAARASGLGEVSLSVLFPVVVVGLMFGAACGAPDEVVRHAGPAQAGGNTGGEGAGGVGGSTGQPNGGLTRQGGVGDSGGVVGTGGKSSAGGTIGSGGASTTGGKSGAGGTTATGGKSGAGGTTATGGKGGTSATGGISAAGGKGGAGGGTGGIGGASGTGGTNPFASGGSSKGDAGGGAGGTSTVSSGGGGAAGGAGGTTSTSTAPASGLQVWVAQKTTGATGQISLNLRIDNRTSQTVDMSTVTLRYWYQDEGLGTAVVVATNYVSIGYSNLGKVMGCTVVAAPSPVAGADHYLELSFSGTLAVQGDKATNDQFNIQVTLHTASYQGAVDVTNDYSYDGGAALLYEQKITLHNKSGTAIWGTAPGKG